MRIPAVAFGLVLLCASSVDAQPETRLWQALENRPSSVQDVAASAGAMAALSRVLRGAIGDGPLESYRIFSGALGLTLFPFAGLVGHRDWERTRALHRRCLGPLSPECEAALSRIARGAARRAYAVRMFQGAARLVQGAFIAPFALSAERLIPTNFGDVLSLLVAVLEVFRGLWDLSHPTEIEQAWTEFRTSRVLGYRW